MVLPLTLTPERSASQGAGVVHVGGGTGGHRQNLREVPGVQRDRGDGLLIDEGAGGRRGGAQAAVAFDFVRRGRLRSRLVSSTGTSETLTVSCGMRAVLKPWGRKIDLVGGRGQEREAVAALVIGDGFLGLVCGGVEEGDDGSGEGGAGFVPYGAFEGSGGGGLGMEGYGRQQG